MASIHVLITPKIKQEYNSQYSRTLCHNDSSNYRGWGKQCIYCLQHKDYCKTEDGMMGRCSGWLVTTVSGKLAEFNFNLTSTFFRCCVFSPPANSFFSFSHSTVQNFALLLIRKHAQQVGLIICSIMSCRAHPAETGEGCAAIGNYQVLPTTTSFIKRTVHAK